MASIVLIPGAIRSKLITAMEVRARLEASGHRVTLLVPDEPEVTSAGLDAVRCAPSVDTDAEVCDRYLAILAQFSPDLVLIDIEAHPFIIAAASAGHRVALLNVFFNLWKHPDAPPLHVPVTPGVGLAGTRPGIEFAWLRYRLWRWLELSRSRRRHDGSLRHLEGFARHVGFSLEEEVDYYQGLLPFVYRRLPVLNTNLLELDLPHRPAAGCHYVGPMTNATRTEFAFSQDEREAMLRIETISHDARRENSAAKLIYCAFGSYYFGNDKKFLQRILSAIAEKADWTAIVGLGARMAVGDIGTVPDNVHVFPWAPQMYALEHADCAVIHGGMTSVYECLHHGVPMLVYPYAEIFDQFGTAARVRYHRVGMVGDRRKDSVQTIRSQIERTLDNEEFRRNVAVMQQLMLTYRDEERAGRAVDSIIQSFHPTMQARESLADRANASG